QAPHVDVLAALAGEEEGNLAGLGAAAAEDALPLQRLPRLRIVEAGRLARLGDALEQFVLAAEVDEEPLRRREIGCGRILAFGRPAGLDAAEEIVQPVLQ